MLCAVRPCCQVFRTYNASITLDRLLAEGATGDTVDAKCADYNRANKEVRAGGPTGAQRTQRRAQRGTKCGQAMQRSACAVHRKC